MTKYHFHPPNVAMNNIKSYDLKLPNPLYVLKILSHNHSLIICLSFVCHLYVNRMLLVRHSYVTRMYSYVIRMLLVCTGVLSVYTRISLACHSYILACYSYVLLCHLYVIHMYPYAIPRSLVYTRMSFVCHRCTYSYVICMSLVCTRM